MFHLYKNYQYLFGCSLLLLILFIAIVGQTPARKGVYIPYDDAQPIVGALEEILPTELKGKVRLNKNFCGQDG